MACFACVSRLLVRTRMPPDDWIIEGTSILSRFQPRGIGQNIRVVEFQNQVARVRLIPRPDRLAGFAALVPDVHEYVLIFALPLWIAHVAENVLLGCLALIERNMITFEKQRRIAA